MQVWCLHRPMVSILSRSSPAHQPFDIVLKVMTFLMTSLNVLTLSGFRDTLLRVETLIYIPFMPF